MIRLWLLVICWSHYALTQPLDPVQYSALMNVYTGLGSLLVDIESLSHVFGFHAGCNGTVCPRFPNTSCMGLFLNCSGGSVTYLCVSDSGSVLSLSLCLKRSLTSQELGRQEFDWVISTSNRRIDKSRALVRRVPRSGAFLSLMNLMSAGICPTIN